MPSMRVIYVHGVSEREEDPDYRPKLAKLGQDFQELVAHRLGYRMETIQDAPWGQLRPQVKLPKAGKNGEFEVFDAGVESPLEPLQLTDYLNDKGEVNAGAFMESLLLRDHSLSDLELSAGQKYAIDLHERGVAISLGDANNDIGRAAELLIAAMPSEKFSPHESFDGQSFGDMAKSAFKKALDKVQSGAEYIGLRPRDFVSRQLLMRWLDIVWYIGPGGFDVQKKIISDFDRITRGNTDHVNVVLAHSLGGLISLQAMNSDMFGTKGLDKRGRWILLCFGSQLPVYLQLNILGNKNFVGSAAGVANYRNIVDPNDPLGYLLGDKEIDAEIKTGANTYHSHTEYLRSKIALIEAREKIAEIMRRW